MCSVFSVQIKKIAKFTTFLAEKMCIYIKFTKNYNFLQKKNGLKTPFFSLFCTKKYNFFHQSLTKVYKSGIIKWKGRLKMNTKITISLTETVLKKLDKICLEKGLKRSQAISLLISEKN